MTEESWEHQAACVKHADLFAATYKRSSLTQQQDAARVCGTCHVRAECNTERVKMTEPWGVWAGIMFKGSHDSGYNPLAFPRTAQGKRQDRELEMAQLPRRARPTVPDPLENLPMEELRRARALKRAGVTTPDVIAKARTYARIMNRRRRQQKRGEAPT